MSVHLGDEAGVIVPRMLDALLGRDGADWTASVSDLSGQDAYVLMTAAFTVAAYRRWPADPTGEEIATFAAVAAASTLDVGTRVAPSTVEAVLRAAFGESELLAGLNPRDVVAAHVLVIHEIQDAGLLDGPDRASYVTEVVDAVA